MYQKSCFKTSKVHIAMILVIKKLTSTYNLFTIPSRRLKRHSSGEQLGQKNASPRLTTQTFVTYIKCIQCLHPSHDTHFVNITNSLYLTGFLG